ncbi:hypothetical protein COB18_02675 [Candidatus Kaiserbacteria bacterium]|nr:MAG: hypothetical protein COB18_02675 [Candidatus Kaiserbacteria bacterium]
MSYTFIAAFIIMLASLVGIIFTWYSAGTWLQKNLRYLVTFSAGVFIIVSYGLFTESIELGGNIIYVALSALLGAVLLEGASRLIPNSHHHHGPTSEHEHTPTDARRLLLGDALHNTIDGILLVPAFLIDIRVGIATTLAIFLHEIVQEISEFFVLKEAGFSTARALIVNFIVSSTILIGVFISLFTSSASNMIPLLTSFAAGAFLYVIFRDLLPSTFRDIQRAKNYTHHAAAAVLGILVMFGVTAITPHELHEVEEHTDNISSEY